MYINHTTGRIYVPTRHSVRRDNMTAKKRLEFMFSIDIIDNFNM